MESLGKNHSHEKKIEEKNKEGENSNKENSCLLNDANSELIDDFYENFSIDSKMSLESILNLNLNYKDKTLRRSSLNDNLILFNTSNSNISNNNSSDKNVIKTLVTPSHKKTRSKAEIPLSHFDKVKNTEVFSSKLKLEDEISLNPTHDKDSISNLHLHLDNINLESVKKNNFSTKNKKVNLLSQMSFSQNTALESNSSSSSKKFHKIKKLGTGSFGKVYLVKDNKNKHYALKKYFYNKEINYKKIIDNQVQLLKELKDPSIPDVYDFFTINDYNYILQDYYPISLENLISKLFEDKENKNLENQSYESKDFFKSIVYQILHGLAYLHTNKILHRDLKPSNIMFTKTGILKFIDFDLARKIESEDQSLSTNVGTLYYRPAELLLGEKSYGFSLDLWAVGCIFAEMFLGRPIFQGEGEISILNKINSIIGAITPDLLPNIDSLKSYLTFNNPDDPLFPSLFKNCCDPFKNLIKNFLRLDPNKRISAKDSLFSEYFSDFNIWESSQILSMFLCEVMSKK